MQPMALPIGALSICEIVLNDGPTVKAAELEVMPTPALASSPGVRCRQSRQAAISCLGPWKANAPPDIRRRLAAVIMAAMAKETRDFLGFARKLASELGFGRS
jgi:hypothetical protein